MPDKKILKILIVDDHPLMRAGISGEVQAQPDMTVIAEAKDGEEPAGPAGSVKIKGVQRVKYLEDKHLLPLRITTVLYYRRKRFRDRNRAWG